MLLVLGLSVVALGCETTPIFNEHFGDATRANKQKMVANPEAGTLPDDGTSEIEGVTVEATLERYRREQTSTSTGSLPQSLLMQGVRSSR